MRPFGSGDGARRMVWQAGRPYGGGRAGVHLYDAEQAAADTVKATTQPFRSCGENAAFSVLPPLSFLSYPVCGGKHKYCKKARCPGAWKDGGVQHDTFRCIAIVRSARKGSKTLLGEKDDRKTVQGIHRCRMSYGSGGVRYAGYFMGMGIGRAALQHIHAGLWKGRCGRGRFVFQDGNRRIRRIQMVHAGLQAFRL